MKLFISSAFLIFLLVGCTGTSVVSGDGGATETVNAQIIIADTTVTVKVSSDSMTSADIMLFDVNYNPAYQSGYKDSVFVNAKNSTVTYKVNSGFYNLLILSRENSKSLAVKDLNLRIGGQQIINDTLKSDGAIQGKIVPGSFSENSDVYYKLYITGTPFFTEVYDGNFKLSGIPEGTYHVEISMCSIDLKSDKHYTKMLGRDIDVLANDTTDSIEFFISN